MVESRKFGFMISSGKMERLTTSTSSPSLKNWRQPRRSRCRQGDHQFHDPGTIEVTLIIIFCCADLKNSARPRIFAADCHAHGCKEPAEDFSEFILLSFRFLFCILGFTDSHD